MAFLNDERREGPMKGAVRLVIQKVNSRRTKVDYFPEIPRSCVIVNSIGSCSRSHFFGTHADWVRMCPPTFYILPVGPCRPFQEVQREAELARRAMAVYVELRDDVFDVEEDGWMNAHGLRVLRNALTEVTVPLANDII
jgi:hypothetical protein